MMKMSDAARGPPTLGLPPPYPGLQVFRLLRLGPVEDIQTPRKASVVVVPPDGCRSALGVLAFGGWGGGSGTRGGTRCCGRSLRSLNGLQPQPQLCVIGTQLGGMKEGGIRGGWMCGEGMAALSWMG